MKEHRIDQLQNSIKGSKNKLSKPKTRGFGYQVLGFGAGGAGRQIDVPISFLILAGGGGGGGAAPVGPKGGGGGAGGFRNSYPGSPSGGPSTTLTQITGAEGTYTVTVGSGGGAGCRGSSSQRQ